MTYVMLGGDFLVSLVAILLTGGLNSGFLLYALAPVLTASLLFHEVFAIALAAITSASLALAHLVLYRWVDQYVWIMEGNNLVSLIVFCSFDVSNCFCCVPHQLEHPSPHRSGCCDSGAPTDQARVGTMA